MGEKLLKKGKIGGIWRLAVMAAVYEEIKAAADDMDYDRLEGILDEMKDYRIPEDHREMFSALETAISNFDYDTITDMLEGK